MPAQYVCLGGRLWKLSFKVARSTGKSSALKNRKMMPKIKLGVGDANFSTAPAFKKVAKELSRVVTLLQKS